MKKWISYMLIFTLAITLIVPLQQASAADTSRAAIITQFTGTVEVKKAGGKKIIKAFKNMSLNQGDEITTGSNGTATLLFSNSGKTDDQFVLEESTTITLSKVSNKKGTVTKVKMKEGKVWVDVASIQNNDDQFQLETPTAIMGVRGTNLVVGVDPRTGNTMTGVFSGIVNYNPTNNRGNAGINLYPSQITNTSDPNGQPKQMSNDTLDELLRNSSSQVINSIINNLNKINQENQDKRNSTGGSGSTNPNLVSQNLNVMSYAMLEQLYKLNKITYEEYNKKLAELDAASNTGSSTPPSNQLNTDGNTFDFNASNNVNSQNNNQLANQALIDKLRKQQEEQKKKNDEKLAQMNNQAMNNFLNKLNQDEQNRLKNRQQLLLNMQNPPPSLPPIINNNSDSSLDDGDDDNSELPGRGDGECEDKDPDAWYLGAIEGLLPVHFIVTEYEFQEEPVEYSTAEEIISVSDNGTMFLVNAYIELAEGDNIRFYINEQLSEVMEIHTIDFNGRNLDSFMLEGGVTIQEGDSLSDMMFSLILRQLNPDEGLEPKMVFVSFMINASYS